MENPTGTGSKWESGVQRGKGNPISNTGTWESGVTRGKGNPISNTGNWESGAVHGKANPVTTNEDAGYNGKTLISIDVQPEYEDGVSFSMNAWVNMINSHQGTLVFIQRL